MSSNERPDLTNILYKIKYTAFVYFETCYSISNLALNNTLPSTK